MRDTHMRSNSNVSFFSGQKLGRGYSRYERGEGGLCPISKFQRYNNILIYSGGGGGGAGELFGRNTVSGSHHESLL